ncbi:MAG: hypothetical protein RLZZ230_162 [Candidatus Parcubacteria bacterium]|jgi:hypothetical protein
MIFLKNPIIAATIACLCVIFIYIANTGKYFGKLINRYFPCEQNPANSFPCFGGYDIAVIIFCVVLLVICAGIIISQIFGKFNV